MAREDGTWCLEIRKPSESLRNQRGGQPLAETFRLLAESANFPVFSEEVLWRAVWDDFRNWLISAISIAGFSGRRACRRYSARSDTIGSTADARRAGP
jgi:hypothetical protein